MDDRDGSAASRALTAAFVNSGYFTYAGPAHSGEALEAMIDRDQARAALVIPANYASDLEKRVPVRIQVIVNGDNANTASAVVGYAGSIVAEAGAELVARTTGTSPRPLVGLEPRVWYNPQLRSTLFLVPGLIAYISMITAVISTALAVVREKERGTMEQIRMAPVTPLAFVIGKTVPYSVIAFASALLIIVVSMALFDLPQRGSWWLLCLSIGLFLIGAQGQGLLISTVAPTQQVAFQLALLSQLPAHLHPLRLHLPDHQHAGGGAGDHLRGAGALLPGGAAQRGAQGRRPRGLLAGPGGAGGLRHGGARPGRAAAAAGMAVRA